MRASVQPTFVRFVFELPEGVGVSSVLNEKTLTLTFNAGLVFDLADAKLSAPPNVASIGQAMDGNRTAVEIALIGDVDVKSFREDKSYVVDIGFQQTEKPSPLAKLPLAADAGRGQSASPQKPAGERAAKLSAGRQQSCRQAPRRSRAKPRRTRPRSKSRLRRAGAGQGRSGQAGRRQGRSRSSLKQPDRACQA